MKLNSHPMKLRLTKLRKIFTKFNTLHDCTRPIIIDNLVFTDPSLSLGPFRSWPEILFQEILNILKILFREVISYTISDFIFNVFEIFLGHDLNYFFYYDRDPVVSPITRNWTNAIKF